MRKILGRWGYAAHLAAALAGGLAAYAVLLAAHEAMGYPGDVITAVLFFLATQTAFAIIWRRQVMDRNSLAMPGTYLALGVTVIAIPSGLIGLRGAFLAMASVPEVGAPLLIPFLAEVFGFLAGFGLLMAPATWLVWRRLGQLA
ncbi:MAG: hypothetical protein JNJ73_09955 [Hyphomonadaceae bacterium]|nr:hypothetical protein [Hyphomonadaceae bacterium]